MTQLTSTCAFDQTTSILPPPDVSKAGYPLHEAIDLDDRDSVEIILRKFPISMQQSNETGTPLHFAALKGNIEITKIILSHQLMVPPSQNLLNKYDKNINTPLHIASINGSYEIINLLLENKVNIEIYNKQKLTPLACAVINYLHTQHQKYILSVEALLNAKAKTDNIFDDETLLHKLIKNPKTISWNMVALFLKHKAYILNEINGETEESLIRTALNDANLSSIEKSKYEDLLNSLLNEIL